MPFVNTSSNTQTPLGWFSIAGMTKAISQFVTRMQVSKMRSVLWAMSDQQLDEIDVKRGNIAHHAEMLVTGVSTAKQ